MSWKQCYWLYWRRSWDKVESRTGWLLSCCPSASCHPCFASAEKWQTWFTTSVIPGEALSVGTQEGHWGSRRREVLLPVCSWFLSAFPALAFLSSTNNHPEAAAGSSFLILPEPKAWCPLKKPSPSRLATPPQGPEYQLWSTVCTPPTPLGSSKFPHLYNSTSSVSSTSPSGSFSLQVTPFVFSSSIPD